jgi:ATP-binding cassette, subfamily B, multidrug efflux pump
MQLAQRQQQRADNRQGRQALGRAIGYLWRYPRYTTAATLALLLATAAQLAVPQLVQEVIDSIVANAVAVDLDLGLALRGLLLAVVIIVIIAAARGLFAFAQTYLSQALSQNIAFELRNDLFAKIQRLSFSYHDQNQTGQLMIRATDDVERLRVFIGQALLLALQALLLLVGTLALLFATNVRLTLVVIPILPIALIVFMIFGSVAQPLFRRIQEKLSAVNTILQENLAGLKVVKAFATERREQARFRHSIDDLLDERIIVSRTFSFLFPFIFLIANLGQAAILYFGGREIIGGSLTLGEWQKFSLYLTYLFLPMGQLGFIIALTAQAAASAQRIFEILEAKNKVTDKPGAIDLPAIQGEVVFDNVGFRYFASGEPVLQQVSFRAAPGQTVALLGSTGSGKTTIINLIPRFYDVSEGRITIDGYDIRDVTIESLRTQIGIVLQETTLFSGTIRDNIAYGRPDATLYEIEAAAKAAAAHDFIMSFPQGYETPVGERGSTLSGGQRQRIAIARALLLDPQILILDDSTSSVDLQTEFLIQQALDKLLEGRTSFVIAQRVSTVVNADQILILDQGQIVDRGAHEELLENSAIYAEIYYSQLAD